MEDNINDLLDFYPMRPDHNISKYLDKHFNDLTKCVDLELYSSGFYHLHLIYMTIVYFHVGRIITEHPKQAEGSLIGFDKRLEDDIKLTNKNGVSIDINKLYCVKERHIFRYFVLIKVDQSILKEARNLIDRRNIFFHANPQPDILTDHTFFQNYEKYIGSLVKITDSAKEFSQKIYDQSIKDINTEKELDENDLEEIFPIFSKYELHMLSKASSEKKTANQILNLIGER